MSSRTHDGRTGVADEPCELAGRTGLSRRRFALAGAAVALGGTSLMPRRPVSARDAVQATTQYRTTAALNLRGGPGTTYPVLAVLPAGTTVSGTATVTAGFRQVTANGIAGWVSTDFIVLVAGEQPPAGGIAGYTTVAVNLRSSPSYGNNVMRVLAAGTPVQVTTERSGDFVLVGADGTPGWVFAAYVATGSAPGGTPPPPPSGETVAVTTADLNLREAPSTAARVLAVIPAGARVTVTGATQDGFTPVNWNGRPGWASARYLADGTRYRTTAAVNFRSRPALDGPILAVLPAGTDLIYVGTGKAPPTGWAGEFSYGGQTGYVFAQYITTV